MATREKIREGIASRLWYRTSLPSVNIKWEELIAFAKDAWLHSAEDEMKILHSQGVVIKMKCPDCIWSQFVGEEVVGMTPCHRCNSTGYITEPLIEE